MIPYGRQDINEADIAAVVNVLRSDFLTQGPAVPAFEIAIAGFCGAQHAVSVNSATSALHIACLALGVGSEIAARLGTLVPIESQVAQPPQEPAQSLRVVALLVGILDAQDEPPVVAPGKEIVEQRRARAAHVKIARGAGGIAHPHRLGRCCHFGNLSIAKDAGAA